MTRATLMAKPRLSKKQKAAKRRKSFARGRKPAAPVFPGGRAIPLSKNPRRCEFAMWFWLNRVLLFPPLVAARIATAFVDRRSVITAIEETRDGTRYEGIQASYQGGADNSANGDTLKDRCNYLLRHAEATQKRLGKADLSWLGRSIIALTELYATAGGGDADRISKLVNSLAADGWDHVMGPPGISANPN
jgi:hypothetical protein